MKKRAQLPNVQTYTIMFRGMAKSEHPKLAVSEAIRHYNILMRDSRLEPNSTHMNAVINVCGRAGDLDSMFTILDTINESTRSPTPYTYTSVLNALKYTTLNEIKDLDEEQKQQNLEKMVNRAQALWEEVIDKWRKGRLLVDEELVCAMGRLLAASSKEHQRSILDLLEQTMNIPNMSKSDSANPATDSKAVVPSKTQGAFAQPGRNTLGLVLTVIARARLTTSGIKYWNHLVRERGVVPDMDNWLRLFSMLSVARASAHASEILDLVPDEFINYKFYRMAMMACIRDNINQNAIKNSNRVLDSMIKRLSFPDAHAMRLYLRVSMVSHSAHRAKAKEGDEEGAKRAYGKQIVEALGKLWDPYRKLHTRYFKDVTPKKGPDELYNNQREVIALARIMYSSFSKVTQEQLIPEEEVKELHEVGARINKEIQKFYKNREEMEPGLSTKTKATHDMSEFDYRPQGDFVWDTTKKDEPPLSTTRDDRERQWRGASRGEEGGRRERAPREQNRGRRDQFESRDGEKPYRPRRQNENEDGGKPWERRNRYESQDGDQPRTRRSHNENEDGSKPWVQRNPYGEKPYRPRSQNENSDGGKPWERRNRYESRDGDKPRPRRSYNNDNEDGGRQRNRYESRDGDRPRARRNRDDFQDGDRPRARRARPEAEEGPWAKLTKGRFQEEPPRRNRSHRDTF